MDLDVFEVFGIPTQEIPENAILQRDWCSWSFIQLPSETLTCDDIIDCVQWELDNLWAAVNWKISCQQLASCPAFVGLQTQIDNLPDSILGGVHFYVNTLNDSASSEFMNWDVVQFYWLDGIRVLTNPVSGVFEVRLPSWANHRDVLVWDEDSNWVVWSTIADCLCNQIATCPSITALENMYTALQNQINYLLGLDPSDQPVLTCSDVARCIWAGTTDVDHAMAEWILHRAERGNLMDQIWDIITEMATITIRNCTDVMACQGIQNLVNTVTAHGVRIDDLEWEVTAIRGIVNNHTDRIAALEASVDGYDTIIAQLQTNYTQVLALVNNHEWRITANEADILTLQWEMAANIIRNCSDVMACPGIQNLSNGYVNLLTRMEDTEWEISAIWDILNPLSNTVASLTTGLDNVDWVLAALQNNYIQILALTNNHEWRITAIEADILALQWWTSWDVIRTCSDVMACQGILDLVFATADLDWRVTAIENCCGAISVNQWDTEITNKLINLTFDEDYFSLTENPSWVVTVTLNNDFIDNLIDDAHIQQVAEDHLFVQYNETVKNWLQRNKRKNVQMLGLPSYSIDINDLVEYKLFCSSSAINDIQLPSGLDPNWVPEQLIWRYVTVVNSSAGGNVSVTVDSNNTILYWPTSIEPWESRTFVIVENDGVWTKYVSLSR